MKVRLLPRLLEMGDCLGTAGHLSTPLEMTGKKVAQNSYVCPMREMK